MSLSAMRSVLVMQAVVVVVVETVSSVVARVALDCSSVVVL